MPALSTLVEPADRGPSKSFLGGRLDLIAVLHIIHKRMEIRLIGDVTGFSAFRVGRSQILGLALSLRIHCQDCAVVRFQTVRPGRERTSLPWVNSSRSRGRGDSHLLERPAQGISRKVAWRACLGRRRIFSNSRDHPPAIHPRYSAPVPE